MISVPVELGARRYEVEIGRGLRHDLARVISDSVGPGVRRAVVVTQEPVVAAGWADGLDLGVPHEIVVVGDGERSKSLATIETLTSGFARDGLARTDVVVALGGGVVTDLAGFAAATYHRGMAYINVATSLLAQVDAAIGGKTGVNLPEGKNLVGSFWQPRAVLCDTETLTSLPAREWACGRGEMAKYAFLGPGEPDASLLSLDLDEQVARCASIKAEVVAADEHEGDRRMVLNYGHTLAHALEASAFGDESLSLRHGEAVAIGLVFAALLARRLGRIDDDRVELHRKVVGAFDLSSRLPERDPHELVSLMGRDKKAAHDLTFVLDGEKGVEVVRGVGEDQVLATLEEMEAAT